MKIAHVREQHAPAGAPWRLAAALDPEGARWLDLEAARRSLVAAQPGRAHNSVLFRQPVTTLDAHLAAGLRVEALADLLAADAEEPMDASDLRFGPPILQPPTFRDFYAFERHVGTMWKRRDMEIPEAWYRMPIFYFSNVSEIRGPGDPVWAPLGSSELDYELEVAALVDTPVRDLDAARGSDAIGGYMVLNDWSARDLQREETTVRLGPGQGQGLRVVDRPMAGHAGRAGGCPQRQGLRSCDDGDASTDRSSRGERGRPRTSASARWSRAPPPTCRCAPATSSDPARSAPAACSRCATRS